jgi:ABC-type antimicrobial peptide transport system permease subunit
VALVIGNTLARLVEEERNQIACYKSLGFKDGPIFLKYESFAFISVAGGALIGHFVISNVLATIIYNAFSLSFAMPSMTSYTSPLWGFLGLALAIIVSVVTTFIVLKSYLQEKPASLLKPKSPKAGKSLLIEKSKHLWKKIPFSWKSTIRNLFRNKPRLLMTVLTVSGSVALEVAAFGILASARANNDGSTALLSSISVLLLVCSLALSILVIYNLTNITLSERKRDLATLMVLGYRNHEVSSYIYREITIMVIFGIIIGLPLGVGFTAIVFNYVDFGSIADLSWQYYLIVAGLELLTSVLVDLLLYPRIIHIDMNASLKAIE